MGSKKRHCIEHQKEEGQSSVSEKNETRKKSKTTTTTSVPFDCRYIVAPMVGASELPFRILCRKYGAQLVYTPMMLASEFATSREYREKEFQTTPFDRPLVCHFAANNAEDFSTAAKLAEPHCDAIDLNLGCPQRTAYVGHFGSYLLDAKDRPLVLGMVQTASLAVKIPIFVKIRLLETYEDTLELCQQLYDAGASLVAIHARYRASFHRKGAGARDGPALLDQVQRLRQDLSSEKYRDKLLVTNGNTVTYEDVVKNLELTKADCIMSAEGILDNPALYLGRFGDRPQGKNDNGNKDDGNSTGMIEVKGGKVLEDLPKRKKWLVKMKKIVSIEAKIEKEGIAAIGRKETKKLSKKEALQTKLRNFRTTGSTFVSLNELYNTSDDKVQLALEYLNLVRQYPAIMRTVIFHTRRMIKDELTTYQMMEECLACSSIDNVESVVSKILRYRENPGSFQFDVERAKKSREALERKKIEEGKRKAYEARMIRKAKREKREDLEYYLRQGAAIPTCRTIEKMKTLSKEDQLQMWKDRDHSQHCMSFHLLGNCPRGQGCAFLHVSSQTKNSFEEGEEVAG